LQNTIQIKDLSFLIMKTAANEPRWCKTRIEKLLNRKKFTSNDLINK